MKLDKEKYKDGYKVTDEYFEDFQEQLFAAIAEEDAKKTSKKLFLKPFYKRKTVWAVAASVALLIGVFSLLMIKEPVQQEEKIAAISLADVRADDIELFLDAQSMMMEEQDFMELIIEDIDELDEAFLSME